MLHNMLRAAAGRDRIPTDGLVAWYTMDNISGSTLVDEQGSYNGTITGATQVVGKIGQALNFNGNDYVSAPFGQQSNTITWSFWFNTTQTTVGFFVAQLQPSAGLPRGVIVSSSGMTFFSRDSGSGFQATPSLTGFQDGAWHLAVAEQDGVNLSILIDDVSLATKTMPSALSPSSWLAGSAFGYNANDTNGDGYYVGLLDQFRQYNRVLTAEEKTALFNEV